MNPASASSIPANEFDRFLTVLPEALRDDCRSRLAGSGLSPDHPVFQVLADFFEKASSGKEIIPDFLEEARLHSQLSKQLLADLQEIPKTILSQIEPQLHGLLAALIGPVEKLGSTATDLQRNVEALPVLLLPKRSTQKPPSDKWWDQLKWWWWECLLMARSMVADHLAWVVTGSISLSVAVSVLSLGASNLSRYYENSYQQRLARMEADSVENTVALNRLLIAGISLKVEKNKDGDACFLILQGAHKAAQPVNSPEGLAVEVWP